MGPPHKGQRKENPFGMKTHKAVQIVAAIKAGQIPFSLAYNKKTLSEVEN